jgi:hypothetical protein
MVRKYSKALAAGISAAVATLVFVWPDGITPGEYGAIASSFVVALLGTFIAPKNVYPPVAVPPNNPVQDNGA